MSLWGANDLIAVPGFTDGTPAPLLEQQPLNTGQLLVLV